MDFHTMNIPIDYETAQKANQIIVTIVDHDGDATVHVLKNRYGKPNADRFTCESALGLLRVLFKLFILDAGRVLDDKELTKLDNKLNY